MLLFLFTIKKLYDFVWYTFLTSFGLLEGNVFETVIGVYEFPCNCALNGFCHARKVKDEINQSNQYINIY